MIRSDRSSRRSPLPRKSRRSTLFSTAAVAVAGLVALSLFGGCGDESKTTGTQLQLSPEVKAELDDIRSAQKDVRAERKQERAEARKKRR
jgi:hypothetical protein